MNKMRKLVDVARFGKQLTLAGLSQDRQDRQEACSYSFECEYFNPNSAGCYKPQSRKCGINIGCGMHECLIDIGKDGVEGMLRGEID